IRRLPPNKLCHLDSRTDDARESIRADLHFDRMSKVPCIDGDQSQRVTLNRVQAFAHEIADFLRYFLVDIAQLPTEPCHPRQSATTRLLSQCLSLTCLCQFGTLRCMKFPDHPIFPAAPSKAPLTPHGFRDASTDPEQISAWWQRWPDALVAVPTGRQSGILVVDIDPEALPWYE